LQAILHMTLDELHDFDNVVVPCAPSVASLISQVEPSTTTMAVTHKEEEKEVDEPQMWMLTRRLMQ
jgi:hypothetical protein